MTFYVYGLCDPNTGELRYVGQTSDVSRRVIQHCSQLNTLTSKWVESLGARPTVVVFASCEDRIKALDIERSVIESVWDSSRLFNAPPGECLNANMKQRERMLPDSPGVALFNWRKANGLSLNKVAALMEKHGGKVNKSTLLRIEKGDSVHVHERTRVAIELATGGEISRDLWSVQ